MVLFYICGLVEVVFIEALRLMEADNDKGDQCSENIVLHVLREVVIKLSLFESKNCVELLRAKPIL